MVQNIFLYDNSNNRIELNVPEILLIKEFKDLMQNERNICKEDPKGQYGLRAFKEFTYIWLAIDWKSIYSDYSEQERHQEALKDSGITESEFNDPLFRAACRKYRDIQESNRSIKLLKAAQTAVDNFIDYFNSVDPLERDPTTGKPIYKVKDIMAEMSTLSKVLDELQTLEGMVKKDLTDNSNMRGGVSEDFDPGEF